MTEPVTPPVRVDPIRVVPKEERKERPPKRETRPNPPKHPSSPTPNEEETHQLDVEV